MSTLVASLTALANPRIWWVAPALALVLVLALAGWVVVAHARHQASEIRALDLALVEVKLARAAAEAEAAEIRGACEAAIGELDGVHEGAVRLSAEIALLEDELRRRAPVPRPRPEASTEACVWLDDVQIRMLEELDRAVFRGGNSTGLVRLRAQDGDREPRGGAGGAGQPQALRVAPRVRPAARDGRRAARASLSCRPGGRRLPPQARGGGSYPATLRGQ